MPSIERDPPVPSTNPAIFGSDVFALCLRALGIPYVALNPGSSFRGLHDSIVNFLGNRDPQLLLCLHEEAAVALAHGYAKVTERPLAVALHANVGLLHGSMAIFNAWCDRAPMLVVGATGPWDAAKRRPWIDWVHTVSDQGGLVRPFTKWDDQPGSVEAGVESLLRAVQLARTAPCGPTYVNFDSTVQESPLPTLPPLPDVRRYAPPPPAAPAPDLVERAARLLAEAKRPLILMGRVSRSERDWALRVALAERLQAIVLTNQKLAAAFPTDHPLHPFAADTFLTAANEAVRAADVVLSLDWLDLGGTLRQAYGDKVPATVIHASVDLYSHRGFGGEVQALPPVDLYLACPPDAVVGPFLDAVPPRAERPTLPREAPSRPRSGGLTLHDIAESLEAATAGVEVSLTRLPLNWNGALWPFRHPLDFLGGDGGGGVGAGPGLAVGAALALAGTGRLPVAVMGDGDFLMSATALWTAAHYGIPTLIVVANNQSFFNDEQHQERVARARGRPPENRWIGQRITGPAIDLAGLARAQGCVGFGPIEDRGALVDALRRAVALVRDGAICVVDVRLPAAA
jgi:thiamine pyrophosphate-dependent acetolactate synthase large subunit-like protein